MSKNEKGPEMNIETFQEVIDNLIKDNDVHLLLHSPKGTEDVELQDDMGNVSAIQFFILLQGVSKAARTLFKDMGGQKEPWPQMVDALLDLLRQDLMDCIEE